MNTSPVSLKQENSNTFTVYLADIRISSIVNKIKYDLLFYLKRNSFLEIRIEDVVYVIKCTNSGAAGPGGRYTKFSLLSKDQKEIAKIETTTNFFQSIVSAFFTRTNKINYFQYEHYGYQSSVWQDENKKDILVLKNDTVSFDESALVDKNELHLLISLTLCIEKFILKKEKRGLMKSVVSTIVILFIIIMAGFILQAK